MFRLSVQMLAAALPVLIALASSAVEPKKFTLLDDGDRQLLSIAFSSSGHSLAISSRDHEIKLWDLNTLQKIRTISDKTVLVTCMSFSLDEQTLCSGNRDGTIAIWDTMKGHVTQKHTFPGLVWHSIHQLPSGKWLAAASHGKSVHLWTSDHESETKEFIGHEYDVRDVVFSLDGERIVSGDFRGYVRVWHLNGSIEKASTGSVAGSVSKLAVSPNGDVLAIGDSTCELTVCTLPDLLPSKLNSYGDEVESIDYLAISQDGKYLAAGVQDVGKIELWELPNRKCIATLATKVLAAVAFTPDGKTFASVDADGVKLWKMQEQQ